METKVKTKIKTAKQLERHFKGIANYHRIDILLLVSQSRGVNVDNIAQALDCNFKTISEHTCRLVQAGLLNKNYHGRTVVHTLSPYGETIAKFITTFQYS
jgi:predicted transcriptional regulator